MRLALANLARGARDLVDYAAVWWLISRTNLDRGYTAQLAELLVSRLGGKLEYPEPP